MHYVELFEDLPDDLAALKRQQAVLMQQWAVIKQTQPPDPTERNVQGAHWDELKPLYAASRAWWDDPERGGFFHQHIYPVNQEIERLETEIRHQSRTQALQAKRSDTGFDTSEILYHGTNDEFEEFDRKKGRTAAHIYTSPDLDTAEKYGTHVYAVYGRQRPQAVLTAEDMDDRLLRRVHRRGGYKRGYGLSLHDLSEIISNGELYNYTMNSRLQDDVVDTCLDMGFKSVRISDGKPGGGYSDSVIFGDANDLQIVEKIE